MQLLEELKIHPRSRLVLGVFTAFLLFFGIWFALVLRSPSGVPKTLFEVKSGQGFREVVENLKTGGFIRSDMAAKMFFLFSGAAFHLQPGTYLLGGGLGVPDIARIMREGREEVRVVIPEGYSIYEIDGALSENYVLKPGELTAWAKAQSFSVEGRLFPDTYNFFLNSSTSDVAEKMFTNFDAKAKPLLEKDKKNYDRNLIIASLLEKEVTDQKDRQIVAGIILKRLKAGMAIQIDATICYIKRMRGATDCYPLSPLDFKADSLYNTYLYKGLPPSPIGNPGASAIEAALAPIASNYWYYLSDPKKGNTIFSKTLDKQAANRVQFLQK